MNFFEVLVVDEGHVVLGDVVMHYANVVYFDVFSMVQ